MNDRILSLCRQISEMSWQQSSINYTREKADWRWTDLWVLLINIGCKFDVDTLDGITTWCSEDHYRSSIAMPDERHYALAAQMGHVSFCRAYEQLVGRKPFIGKGLSYSSTHFYNYNRHNKSRTRGRLVLDCLFSWNGERLKVTSFNDKKDTVTACSYYLDGFHDYKAKIKRRVTITHKEWQQVQGGKANDSKTSQT